MGRTSDENACATRYGGAIGLDLPYRRHPAALEGDLTMDRLQQTLSRRRFALTAGVGGAALAASAPQLAGAKIVAPEGDAQTMEKATFVLVHGAWHGGWCWKEVVRLLRGAGHEVFAPTLTGLGERVHLLAPEIDLTTHIDDVLGLLEYEDLTNVVLVGHSYAGIVISGV